MAIYRIKLSFDNLIHLVKSYKRVGIIKVYNDLVIGFKQVHQLFNPVIGIMYMSVPFTICFSYELALDHHVHFFGRLLASAALMLACISNYIMYSIASSICVKNKIIAKYLYSIQFDRMSKRVIVRMKIDSFIARLNQEFVGFRCLYFIKFTKLTFYKYILGLSSSYFMINDLVKK